MKFYDEETKKLYDTQEEAEEACAKAIEAKKKAEEEREKLIAERKARADEVEEARKAMVAAQKEYEKLISEFLRDYKTYHYSTSDIEDIPRVFNTWDWLWKF